MKLQQTFLLIAVITFFSANSQNLEMEGKAEYNPQENEKPEKGMNIKENQIDGLNSHVILNLPLTNLKSITEISPFFGFQYSYDQHGGYTNQSPNPKYFRITEQGLEINIYKGDKSHSKKSPTSPRTELAGIGVLRNIKDNRLYQISFSQLISKYPESYGFCWIQIWGALVPTVLVRLKYGVYQLCVKNVACLKLPVHISQDIGQWVNWRLDFLLATSGGFISIFRNSVLLGVLRGNTSGGNNSHFKHGLYTQGIHPPSTMTIYTKNLLFTSNQSDEEVPEPEPKSGSEEAFFKHLQSFTYEDIYSFILN